MIKIIFNETELQQMQNKMREYFQTHWKIFLAEGIFLIVLGTLAILIPQFFTDLIVVVLGWILLFSGIQLIIRSLFIARMPGFGLWLFIGILQVVIGYLFLANPLGGVLTLTMLMSLFFAIEGVAKISFALMMRPMAHWEFVLLSGITPLVLALIIWSGWPQTADWLLGLFLGINLLFAGWSLVKISLHHKDNV
ncbi:MAG: DUF308 domain-containing protein, partial [Methylococcaceae bacterium]|nr:DUF308 domain-containing protein [Methylococcaceae bacterium]